MKRNGILIDQLRERMQEVYELRGVHLESHLRSIQQVQEEDRQLRELWEGQKYIEDKMRQLSGIFQVRFHPKGGELEVRD